MTVAFSDFGTCGPHHFTQSRQRKLGGVELDAQNRRRVAIEADHMRPRDAFPLRQCCNQTAKARGRKSARSRKSVSIPEDLLARSLNRKKKSRSTHNLKNSITNDSI